MLKLSLRKMTALRIVCSAMLLIHHCLKIVYQMCPAELVAAVISSRSSGGISFVCGIAVVPQILQISQRAFFEL
jgi:hypothetical protein